MKMPRNGARSSIIVTLYFVHGAVAPTFAKATVGRQLVVSKPACRQTGLRDTP
jgi:hypothetical protein